MFPISARHARASAPFLLNCQTWMLGTSPAMAHGALICAKLFWPASGEDCDATRVHRTRQQRGGTPTARCACRAPARTCPLFHILGRISARRHTTFQGNPDAAWKEFRCL